MSFGKEENEQQVFFDDSQDMQFQLKHISMLKLLLWKVVLSFGKDLETTETSSLQETKKTLTIFLHLFLSFFASLRLRRKHYFPTTFLSLFVEL